MRPESKALERLNPLGSIKISKRNRETSQRILGTQDLRLKHYPRLFDLELNPMEHSLLSWTTDEMLELH